MGIFGSEERFSPPGQFALQCATLAYERGLSETALENGGSLINNEVYYVFISIV